MSGRRTMYGHMAAHKPDASRLGGMTREQVGAAIDGISAAMRGPMSATERTMSFMDRKDLQARLAEIDAAGATESKGA
jgi:hypothetical protein